MVDLSAIILPAAKAALGQPIVYVAPGADPITIHALTVPVIPLVPGLGGAITLIDRQTALFDVLVSDLPAPVDGAAITSPSGQTFTLRSHRHPDADRQLWRLDCS